MLLPLIQGKMRKRRKEKNWGFRNNHEDKVHPKFRPMSSRLRCTKKLKTRLDLLYIGFML